jgi:hypothetical protein
MGTLEQQRQEFSKGPFLATPISGMIAWLLVALSGIFFSDQVTVWMLFIATGSIVYLALFISKFTGENFLDRNKTKNVFDGLFFFSVAQSVMAYAIAVPFFLIDYTSLPLSVGILTGTMWLPFSWIIEHWIGIAHTIVRTVSIVVLWYVFPQLRFVAIPLAIVLIYMITLIILNNRKKQYS